MELLSRLDYFDIGRRFVLGRGTRISPREIDTEGSNVNLLLGASSYMAQAVAQQNIESSATNLLDACEDDNLDRWGWDRYQELGIRKGAAPAVMRANVSRVVGGSSGSVPIGTKVLSRSGIEYIATTTAPFSNTTLLTPIDLRAVQAGKEFQIGRNQLVRFAKPEALFDASLNITNDEPSAGGEPAETNDVYRERLRRLGASLRRGTLGAIEAGALTVPGVNSATAIEVLGVEGYPAQMVELFIADSSGVASIGLANLVRSALEEWKAGGIYVAIRLSVPVLVNITLRLRFKAGVATAALSEQVRQAFVTYINSLPVNATLYRAEMGAILTRFKADGLIASNDSIVEPVGDIVPAIGTTLRVRPEGVVLV